MYPISHYINDRPEMINQVNNIEPGKNKKEWRTSIPPVQSF